MNHFDHIEYFLPGRGLIVRLERFILRQITLSPKSTEILSYYKSHLSVNGELARQLQSERWVIHPLSNFRLVEAQVKILQFRSPCTTLAHRVNAIRIKQY